MNFRDFKFLELGEISTVTKLAGFEFSKYMEYVENGDIIALRAMNIKNGYLDLENIKKINRNVSDSLIRSKLYKNDIVLTYTGSKYGDSAIIKEDNKFHLAPNVAKITAITVDPYYLFSYFKSNVFREELRNFGGGSSQPTIPMKTIRKMMIPIPSLKEQKAIAKILSDLDEKIEVNNKINKNLEEMAQAIFKQWFVDFEFPNEEGKPYKSSGGEMVESELGMIPKGWKISSLIDIAEYLNGLAMQKFKPNKNEKCLKVLKIKELRQGFTDESSDLCSENIKQEYIINNGDVIFSWSGTLLVDLWGADKCGLNQHLFKVTSNKYYKWYYYYWTKFHLNKFISIAKDKATTMGHIKRSNLSESLVFVPNDSTLKLMNKVMNPIITQVINNKVENKRLEKLRDTLLPKLMSGEIRVPLENNEN
ncbi:restriction endonuclease subunit S [Clostridium perfringens]|uniref:restriction endonuclease subunit S n=1 Tax=Clostridium perfringens TaxID=1502 RepID=UPI0018E43AA5|nr:restriction endonuclease subunit S [Clostridium perfringens]MBI5996136.1 restriction endonuclease subunit S [Clostridium perfringens]